MSSTNGLGEVVIVSLQFSFSNGSAVPKSVMELKRETADESAQRKARSSGVAFIEPIQKCSTSKVLEDLLKYGFVLVDALHQERYNPKAPRVTYHTVRYIFVHKSAYVEDKGSEEFKKKKDEILKDLAVLCEKSLWRVRGFNNPYFQEDKPVDGKRAISINMEVRVPLFHSNGEPILIWDKDAQKNKIGEKPKLIKADAVLRFTP